MIDDRDPNYLARQVADALDERDTARSEAQDARDKLGEVETDRNVLTSWLVLIAEPGCAQYGGIGTCVRRTQQWCGPCSAWAALNDMSLPVRPENRTR